MSLIGPGEADRVAWALNIVRERADLDGLRVLDLGCRTGAFSAAFFYAGADVLGIEGRQENLDHVPPCGARFELGDVRDLSAAKHGTFDVTLCLGILYHLEPGDAVRLLASMREVTKRFAVIDTHLGLGINMAEVDGRAYQGSWYGENRDHPWSAIGNQRSWWFTDDSLERALHDSGWPTVTHIPGRSWPDEPADRVWLVAE